MHAVCLTPGSCAISAINSFWGGLADSLHDAVGQTVTALFGWWTITGPLNLDQPFIHQAQDYVTVWAGIPIAVLAILAAVGWGVMAGGYTWVADLGRGLIVFAITAAASIPIIIALQAWSTELARGLIDAVPTRDVGARITGLLFANGGQAPALIVLWGGVLLLAGTAQYVIMLFRDDAILVLTVAIPVAAAGQFNRGSVLWLPRLAGWLLTFIFYKPTAALIYYLGLSLIGEGHGLHAIASGVCMMLTAVLALPAMLRLVSFATANQPPGGGNALGSATAAASLAASLGQLAARFR